MLQIGFTDSKVQKWYIDVAKTQLGANDVDVVNVINIGSCKW